jgi:hypothetical protein
MLRNIAFLAYQILVQKPNGRKRVTRPKCTQEGNIKIDSGERRGVLDSIGSGQGPVVDSCQHSKESLGPTKVGKFDMLSDY